MICRRPSLFRAMLALLACVSTPEAPLSGAAEPTPPDTPRPLQFRRYYAPADRVSDWPRGDVPYVPIEADEFERLVQSVRSVPEGATTSAAARVVQTYYEARFDGQELLAGNARLEIVHPARGAVLLPLDPCGLAIVKAGWEDPAAPSATLGLAASGKLAVLVERPGNLLVDWNLRGHRDAAGAVSFQLELPRCPFNRLVLDLPAETTPEVSQGVVVSEPAPDAARRHWRLALGGQHRVAVRLTPSDAASRRRQLPLLHEAVTYEFSERGVDVTAELRFDVHNEPLRRLELVLDGGLKLVAARYGGSEEASAIPWSLVSAGQDGTSRVVLELPEPLLGSGRVVRVTAIAPLAPDERWRLPGIHPQGVFWQEGNATLLVPVPLSLEELSPILCRQTETGRLLDPLAGELVKLQYFSPEATAEVILSRQHGEVHLSSGTLVGLGGGEASGEFVAVFSLAAGRRFALVAEVPPPWTIDSVTSLPAEAIASWNLDSSVPDDQVLTIRLARALAPDKPVRLLIAGRALGLPPGKMLPADALRMLDFRDVTARQQLLSARSAELHQVRLVGALELPRLDPGRLTSAQRELFIATPGDWVVELGASAKDWGIALENQRPRYAADIRVEATVTPGPLVESYTIRCLPQSSPLDRIVVHFTHARTEPPRWTGAPDTPGELTTRRWSTDEQVASGLDPQGETWEITLHRPRSAPFELGALRPTSLEGELSVSLVSLPEATVQEGMLVVRSEGATPLAVTNHRLTAAPASVVPENQHHDARAFYRYDPAGEAGAASRRAVSVARPRLAGQQAGALAWSCDFDSRYESNGRGVHLATYGIESAGLPRCTLTLPAEAEVLGVWVDEVELAPDMTGGRIQVNLPPGRKFPTIAVQFATTGAPWGIVGSWEAPLATLDIPVLACRWTLWLPPSYDLIAPAGAWQSLHAAELSWAQRLFGPLGRPDGQAPFDPIAARNWIGLGRPAPPRDLARWRADEVLRRLGLAAAIGTGRSSASVVTWDRLLARADLASGEAAERLLIDGAAVAAAGVGPGTPVRLREAEGQTHLAHGVSLLEEASLVLLVHRDALVLTSAAAAAVDHFRLEALAPLTLYRVRPGPLARRIEAGVAGDSDRYLRPNAWKEYALAPWVTLPRAGSAATDHVGWTAYRMERTPHAPVETRVIHRGTVILAGWGVFLLVLGMGRWRLRERTRALVGWAALFAVAALLAPAACAPIAAGAVWGALVCLALDLACPRRAVGWQSPAAAPAVLARPASAGHPAMLLLAGLLVAGEAVPVRADEEVHRVFIPVDEHGQPTGGRYLVPESFDRELRRRAVVATEEPRGWLLQAAAYRAALSREENPPRLDVTEFTARYDLYVFTAGSRVRIPLSREGANLVPNTALLDGRAVALEWEEGGQALLCPVDAPGLYRLEVSLQPVTRTTGETTGFELTIPPVTTSTLELLLPPETSGVEVPGALGALARSDDGLRLLAQLGATARLAVRWPEGAGSMGAGPSVEVEELLWLHVRPGSVVLDALFKYKVAGGQIRELHLAADQRLRRLPLEGQTSPVADVRTVPGSSKAPADPQTIQLQLTRPVADQVTVQVAFLLTDSSGVGNMRLPLLEARGARSTRRWLGVTVDPALEFDTQNGEPLEVIPVAEFSTAWGQAQTSPLTAFNLPSSDPLWSLATRPREPRTTVEQTLALGFDRGRATVHLTARLTTTQGHNFQYRLTAPPALQIDGISVFEQGNERVTRWARDEAGTITVFLTGPVTGEQHLDLRCRLPTPLAGKIPLPVLRIERAAVASSTTHIFRRPGVLVSIEDRVGAAEAAAPASHETDAGAGRLVESLDARDVNFAASVALAPNEPRVQAVQVTSLVQQGDAWEVEVDCRLVVDQGVVDGLRFRLPVPWNGPFDITPPAASEVIEVPGESGRQLVVRPREAIAGAYRLTIRTPLTFAVGDEVGIPRIAPLGMDHLARFLILPTRMGLEPVAWETAQLKPTTLPEGFSLPSAAPDSWAVYRVAGDRPQVRFRLAARLVDAAQVHLADIHLAWQRDWSCRGVAVFDLAPAGLSSLSLRLPPGWRLEEACVAGVPATAIPAGRDLWRLPLGAPRLPQRIEVVFSGALADPGPAGTLQLAAPALGDLPVMQTLWAVTGPPGSGTGQAGNNGSQVSPLTYELYRFRSLADLVNLPSDVVAAARADDLALWFGDWARVLATSERAVRHRLVGVPTTALTVAATVETATIDRRLAEIARRLGTTAVMDRVAGGTLPAGRPVDLWKHAFEEESGLTQFVVGRAAASPAIRYPYPSPGHREFVWRLACAAAVMLVALAWAVVLRGRAAPDWVRRWPHLVGVLVGLCWWLWLTPSALGWLVVAASLAATLRSGWRAPREPGSTIVPLGSAQA